MDFFPFFVEVVRGDGTTEDGVVMGVLGIPIGETPIPVIDAGGEDLGAISDRVGEVCKCACRGVDSAEGIVAPGGDAATEAPDDGVILGWGDEAARSC